MAVLLIAVSIGSWPQSPVPVIETAAPDQEASLLSIERMQQQNSVQSRPYELTWKYKVFRADDSQPVSEVTAQISFTPPDTKTYRITQVSGNKRGEKIVRAILDQEADAAKQSGNNQITRRNYDFVFLRREDFGVPEYVLLIVPKRKAKNLLRGQIWVDANTFRIRRIEGVLIKSPSIWIRTSMSLCNSRSLTGCGCLSHLTLSPRYVSWGSTHLLDSTLKAHPRSQSHPR